MASLLRRPKQRGLATDQMQRCSCRILKAPLRLNEGYLLESKLSAVHAYACLPSLLVVVQQTQHIVFLELLPALQKIEFNRKPQPGNLSTKLPHQLHRGLHCAASSKQVVDDHDTLPGLNRIEVYCLEMPSIDGSFSNVTSPAVDSRFTELAAE